MRVAGLTALALAAAAYNGGPHNVVNWLKVKARHTELDEFVDLFLHGKLVELQIEEFPVAVSSRLVGSELRDSRIREDTGALVVAIGKHGGQVAFNPSPTTPIQPGDSLIGMGSQEQLDALRELLGP